jgi:glycosyltransferase involved in cell wall biosynthesis
MRNSDIFLDFSVWQAMGLSAMEAMASGCAVVVPRAGGASDFCIHDRNALVIDTSADEACFEAANRLVQDPHLLSRLRQNATIDVCEFTPRRAARRIAAALFAE